MKTMNSKTMITSLLIAFLLVACNTPTMTAAEECTSAKSCKECFHGLMPSNCSWAEDWQECRSHGDGFNSSITVTRAVDCPVTASVYEGRGKYRVYVDNDLFGLLLHMDRVGLNCSSSGRTIGYTAQVIITGISSGEVLCSGPEADFPNRYVSFSFTFGPTSVAWNVKELSLLRFNPDEAWWNAGTVLVTVTVRNSYKLRSHFTMVAVTVAGRPCNFVYHYVDNSQPGQDPDRKWCEVSFKGLWAGKSGPVIAQFRAGASASRKTNFEVRSRYDFSVLAPQLRAVEGPSCGSMNGGTLLTVLGTRLDAPSKLLKMNLLVNSGAMVDRSECLIVKRDKGQLICRTTKWKSTTAPGLLDVLWDDDLELRAPNFQFSYVNEPAPSTSGLRLASSASGGTKFKVAWDSLACVTLNSVFFYIRILGNGGLSEVVRQYTPCRVAADNVTMEWTAPAVSLPNDGTTVVRFDCGFELEFAGGHFDYPCDESDIEYRVYTDAQFALRDL